MAKIRTDVETDFNGEGGSEGIKFLPNTTTRIRIVRNRSVKAITHWGEDAEGTRHRAVCQGKFRRRGMNSDVCPICAAIEAGGKGDVDKGGCGWDLSRRIFMAAVRVERKEVTVKKKDGSTVTKLKWVVIPRAELLGGTDGIGIQIYNQIAKFAKHDSWGKPTGYDFEIERVGSGMTDTEYTVTAIPKDQSAKLPEEVEDPDDLLGDGLTQLAEPTPIETMQEWLGMGDDNEIELDEDFGDEDFGDDEPAVTARPAGEAVDEEDEAEEVIDDPDDEDEEEVVACLDDEDEEEVAEVQGEEDDEF